MQSDEIIGFGLSKDQIFDMIDLCRAWGKSERDRNLLIFEPTSYQDPRYTVLFFYIDGSPPKAFGWLRRVTRGWQISMIMGGEIPSTYWFDLNLMRTTKYRLSKPDGLGFWPTDDTSSNHPVPAQTSHNESP